MALWMTVKGVNLSGNCYLIECLPVNYSMHWLAVYKMACGFLNIIASVIFIYLYLNYQRQNNNSIERFRNIMVFLFLLTETLNILPAIIYCVFYCLTTSPWIRSFGLLILASVNIEGICTSVVYVETFRRRFKCLLQRSKQNRTRALSFPQSTSIYNLPQSATRLFGSVSSGHN
ncbi:hypothetical protein M3Y96_00555500 [Aphelenchoides besseyi]|nr:hypothetical protein M3Y96_00555500 [Aphelenchoides besseyi]